MTRLLAQLLVATVLGWSGIQVSLGAAASKPSASPKALFLPKEAVSAANLNRLEPVLFWRAGEPTLLQRLAGNTTPLVEDVAVCSKRNRLYFNPYTWAGRSSENTVGIYEYDLATGSLVRKNPIPAAVDGTGEDIAISSYSRTIYDLASRMAYVANIDRDGTDCVWSIDLVAGQPTLVASAPFEPFAKGPSDPRLRIPQDLACHPVLSSRVLLLWGGVDTYTQYVCFYLDTSQYSLSKEYALPADRAPWRIMGGCDNCVLATLDREEWYLFRSEAGRLVEVKNLGKRLLVLNSSNFLSASHPRNLVKEYFADAEGVVRVCRLPSMESVASLGSRAAGDFLILPDSGLMAVLSQSKPKVIRIFDLRAGEERAELPLGKPAFGSSWRRLVCDEDGRYIGACDCFQVKLYAVRPEHEGPATGS